MSNQKILLIDYDPASITRTATPLTKAGYQVEVAKDGLAGLAAFERLKPALVLVEAMLPRKHGFEVCQEIKAKPNGKSTPVLITTAVCRGRKYRMDALQIYGCDEYIEKPITDDELLSMVSRFIEQTRQVREEVRQDLSAAIDGASTAVPVAIETMDDDELEAKIDALLMGDDTPAEEDVPASPVAPTRTAAVEAAVEAPAEPAPEASEPAVAEMSPVDQNTPSESATDPQLDAILQVDPGPIDQPAESVLEVETAASRVAEEPLEVPAIAPLIGEVKPRPTTQTAEPGKREWTETSTPKGGSKVVLFGVAAIVVLGAVGLLAFQQGWIGGASGSGPASVEGVAKASSPARNVPTSEPAPVFQPPPEDVAGQPTIDEAAPAGVQQEPVKTRHEPAEPRPFVPPKPSFKSRSAAELQAARDRQARADRAMSTAAGSLQSELLSAQAGDSLAPADEEVQAADVDVDGEALLGTPVRPKASRGELFLIGDVDQVPVPVKFEQPVYDALARRMNQQGVVIVEVLVDETGGVTETRLIQEIPNSRLNEATLRAARRWSYRPAMKDGVPVMVWKSERIVFRLE